MDLRFKQLVDFLYEHEIQYTTTVDKFGDTLQIVLNPKKDNKTCRYYMINISDGLITFEYECEEDNWVSTILYEEHDKWEAINKKELFECVFRELG